MVNQNIEDLVDVLAERFIQLENSFVVRNNEELAKGINMDLSGWRAVKENGFESYQKILAKMAHDSISDTAKKIEKIYLLSYRTIDSNKVIVTETEIYGKDLPKSFLNKIQKEKNAAAEEILKLSNNAFKQYSQSVRVVNPSQSAETIYKTITAQMNKGIEKGIKVNYKVKSGKFKGHVRHVSFKSYMEMNARTTISQEITKQQISSGANSDAIFYVVDAFADCAKDHQDYQGKIYYNERANLTDDAKQYIRKNNIKSMQQVSENKPYLTTRPNCRHAFHMIPTAKVISGHGSDYQERFTYGKMQTNNFKLVEQQRRNERLIRKYKLMKEDAELIYEQTKDKAFKDKARYYSNLQEKWTRANTSLIRDNKSFMKRNKSREDARIIVDDLGVRYDSV